MASVAISCGDDNAPEIETPSFSGEDLTSKASIVRDKESKQASLVLSGITGEWSLYAGPSVEQIDFKQPFLQGKESGTYLLEGIGTSSRSSFQLITSTGKAILAERHLPMEGGYNTRDMGGFKTTDNRFVKWGKVFRSDEINNLSVADITYLNSIPLTSIVDFRSEGERAAAPDKVVSSVKNIHELSLSTGDIKMDASTLALSKEEMITAIRSLNKGFVTDAECIERYTQFFEILQNPASAPLLYHCTAGKDRAGFGSFLFLISLGVSEEVALNDYLASNDYLKGKYAGYLMAFPQIEPLVTVQKEYLQAAIDQMRADYGSVEKFLTDALHADLAKMKELYLY